MTRRLRIAIDMDEVLVDTLARQIEWFRDEYGYEWTKETLAGRRPSDFARPEHCRAHEEVLRRGDFFEDLPPMAGALGVMRELAGRHEVFIATAAMDYPGSFGPKYRWLSRHVPFVPPSHYVFLGDKSVLAADFLVDDNAYNFERFSGVGILFSAPHNLTVSGHTRARDWGDVRRLLVGDPESTGDASPPTTRSPATPAPPPAIFA